MDDPKKKRFLWGIVLAWTPAVFFIPGLVLALKGISEQKATGFGLVAASSAEGAVVFGLVAAAEAGALVLLLGALSRGHWMRSLVSVVTMCWSGFLLTIFSLLLWLSVSGISVNSSTLPF